MKTKVNHTPGPWGVPDIGTGSGNVLVSKGKMADWKGMIASVDAGNYRSSQEEGLANAFLISAAPELLEAAKGALSFMGTIPEIEGGSAPDSIRGKLRSAIEKAEGDQ